MRKLEAKDNAAVLPRLIVSAVTLPDCCICRRNFSWQRLHGGARLSNKTLTWMKNCRWILHYTSIAIKYLCLIALFQAPKELVD